MTNQDYLNIAYNKIDGILQLYRQFKHKNPVMLYDLQANQIYAYPYNDFKETLSQRSQDMLARDYKSANAANETVVFVRDNEGNKLVSFKMDLEITQALDESHANS